ncbi:MAG: hypothetical protein IPO25_19825 [Saprospiraceae bacterium]|nr:hypothetical protein [Saprospiraceae bacterium]
MIKKIWMVIGILSIACLPAISQKKKKTMPVVVAPPSYEIQRRRMLKAFNHLIMHIKISLSRSGIMDYLATKETQSTALLQAILKTKGLWFRRGIAEIPTPL